MADWFRFDTRNVKDADMIALFSEDTAFPWWFTSLVCIAKEAADEDPDTWDGHLVTFSGKGLTVKDLAALLPKHSRKHAEQVANLLRICCERSLMVLESTGTERESTGTEREPADNCYRICNFSRWYRPTEYVKKSSTERVRRKRERDKAEEMKRVPVTHETPLHNSTDITDSTDPPKPPEGAPGEEPINFVDEEIDCEDPENQALQNPDGDKPASKDQSKFRSMLTRNQWAILRGKAHQEFQKISPGGVWKAQEKALDDFLDVRPPPGWRLTPGHWAAQLLKCVESSVADVRSDWSRTQGAGQSKQKAFYQALEEARTQCAQALAKFETEEVQHCG